MENQLLEEVSKKNKKSPKEIAQENIKKFLKELDEQAKKCPYIDDPFENEYQRKTDEDDVVRILDDYDTRKNNVTKQWKELIAKARTEARNGYMDLAKKEKYEVFVKRRIETEKILQDACLGPQDTKKLREAENGLVATIVKIYGIYGLRELDKKDERDGESNEKDKEKDYEE